MWTTVFPGNKHAAAATVARSAILALSRRPSLSWRSCTFGIVCTLEDLALSCRLLLTLCTHVTVVTHSATCLIACSCSDHAPAFNRTSSNRVLTPPSFVGPATDWRAVDPTAATKCNGPITHDKPVTQLYVIKGGGLITKGGVISSEYSRNLEESCFLPLL